jgi:phenylacetate-coenzyme A ligase PaaK-like adenylate-forming protein
MAHPFAVFDPWQTAWACADVLSVTRASAFVWRQRQSARLADLLADAARGSHLYRERLSAVGKAATALETLQRMKPVAKAELMARFADWVTDPRLRLADLRAFVRDPARRGQPFAERWIVWESSGSSGEPGLFVQDARSLAVADALEAGRGPVALSGRFGLERIAYVGAIEGHFAGVVAFERARGLNPWLACNARSFSFMQPLASLVDQLNDFAPTVLASYPSMAWVLSQAQRSGQLKIAPRALWTGGETLTVATRHALAEAFDARVCDSYGASECFLIASECSSQRLHLHADWTVLEPVDDRDRPVPEGEFGTALLTNLANHVQPIIRYRLGDRVRFVPGGCDCGSALPVIEVQGRADDVLTLDDAQGHAVHLAPLAVTTVLEDGAGVFDFQLRRRSPHHLQLDLYDSAPGPSSTLRARQARNALRGFLRQHGLADTRVQCRCAGCAALRGRSGKQQRVVSKGTPARDAVA